MVCGGLILCWFVMCSCCDEVRFVWIVNEVDGSCYG